MATCRVFFSRVSTFLQTRNQLPGYQQCAFLKGKDFEKLGIAPPPKKPLVPFFIYKKETLAKMRAENPQLTQKDVMKLLGTEWEKYPPEKKEIFQKESEAAFDEYKKLLAEYKKSLTVEQLTIIERAREKQKLSKKIRIRRQRRVDLEKPKKPLSAYSIFFREKMLENTEKSGSQSDMMRTYASVWKTLPPEEKKKYRLEYEKSILKYRKDLKAWEAKMVEEGNLDVLGSKALRKLHKEYKEKQERKSEVDN